MLFYEDTLCAFLKVLAERAPDQPMLGCESGWLTVRQVLERVESGARQLHKVGIRPGDYLCIPAQRTVNTCVVMLCLQRLGAVAVLTDPRGEAAAQLKSCEAAIPIKYYLTMNQDVSRPVATLTSTATGKDLCLSMRKKAAGAEVPPFADAKAPGFLIFTSGSTGAKKAVMISQYNLVNDLMDTRELGYYTQDDVALGALPLDHIFGLVLLAGTMVLGYRLYFPKTTDIPHILEAVSTQGITRMNGVPSLYLAMAAEKEKYDLRSLRAGFIAGGPCTPGQFRYIEEALEITLIPAYGMSECVGITCASYRDPQEVRACGVGRFYPRNTWAILLEDGGEAAVGQTGEICVDGPTRMVGYFGDSSPREALFHTGDLGYVDGEGILHLTGRKKDIIIRNGNNISPLVIEDALLSIQGVTAAAVVGLPHPTEGECPAAMVVCRAEIYQTLPQALGSRVQKNLVPALFRRAEALPMTGSGKTDKLRVREMLLQCQGQ